MDGVPPDRGDAEAGGGGVIHGYMDPHRYEVIGAMADKIERFSSDVCKKLGYYVYRLVDPRDGHTFYVG